MAQCQISPCEKNALYTVKVKKSESIDHAYKVCQEHRDQFKQDCKDNGWEFMELS